MELVLVSGLSGSGKSVFLAMLEDLASDAAGFITGQKISVNGGNTLD